jgi:plastocyanin
MVGAVSLAMRPAVNGAAVAQTATVKVSSFQFTPKVLTITPGTTVEWVNEAGRHTVEADDGSFKSDVLKAGDKFEHKFDKAGTFAYHCEFHGEKGGKDMAGKIIVRGK